MRCRTVDPGEVERFVAGAVRYALEERCVRKGTSACWCNHCREGAGRLFIGRLESQDFMLRNGLWAPEQDHPLNILGVGTVTQPMASPKPEAGEVARTLLLKEGGEYRTGSGAGRYELLSGPELFFEGLRNSFYGGSEVFYARREGGWELLESQEPERGVWGKRTPLA